MITVIDYGMGNLHSVQKALESFGEKVIITGTPEDISSSQKIVLPGVGAFDDASVALKQSGLQDAILQAIKNKKIFLGICLGLQLLFEKSQEAKTEKGLGVARGEVKKFPENYGLKVPHMGWNQLEVVAPDCPLLKNVASGAFVYFCHSYYPQPAEKEVIAAKTDYGVSFASVIFQENCFGVQFHPEKSQAVGLQILKNFVEM